MTRGAICNQTCDLRPQASPQFRVRCYSNSGTSLRKIGSGKLVTLISTDVLRFDLFLPAIYFGVVGPVSLVAIYIILGTVVGFAAASAGVAVMVVTIVLQIKVSA